MPEQFQMICPVCDCRFHQQEVERIPYPHGNQRQKRESPQVICFCKQCETGIAYPMPGAEKLEEYYREGTYWDNQHVPKISPEAFPGHYCLAKARWKLIKAELQRNQYTGGLRVLDVGAGHGFLGLLMAEDKSVSLEGYTAIEPDIKQLEGLKAVWQKRHPDVTLHTQTSFEQGEEKYNLIILSHLLEHVENPKEMLGSFLSAIEFPSYIFIDVPHQDCYFKKDVYPHLLFYTKKGIEALCEACGLDVLSIEGYGWPRKKSPLHYRNAKSVWNLLERVFYPFRHILPTGALAGFYSKCFKASEKQVDGTWIRAIAVRK